ncbi:glycosyltransferase family 4 protein (plasmid) [Halarchaeum sp. CBA1220]|uniref:glycosyltransferase family 4 protein n=1 Tax=Halarchaeum sp. CBA1220 TaxID=1853682 RepID=UPI000F3AA384|nr:glycosyltransferase family 4 protein [Halarchaeum sp. CBA1220]QLC35104.1 glycosyltransferase family 4 protein [Halarchaeum sp. CBA1220]
MNILVLSREFPPHVLGGISYHLTNLYNKIADRGHEVTVLGGKCPQSWDELADEVSDQIKTIPVEFGYRKGYYVLYPLALRKKIHDIDTSRFDIAIAHTPIPYTIPGLPLVTKYHDCTPMTRKYMRKSLSTSDKIGDSLLQPFRTVINNRSFKVSDYAIFNSTVNMSGWEEKYSIECPQEIIYNGVDTSKFYPVESSKRDGVLFVGDSNQKGLKSVIRYADSNHRPVHIVGDVDIAHSNIVCHGRVHQDRLRELYSQSAVTVHPAHFESFGNVVVESLACGTPVVTTSSCGASEVLTDEAGVVTTNIKSGVKKASNLNAEDCVSIARQYSWSTVAKRTIKIFKQVITSCANPAGL